MKTHNLLLLFLSISLLSSTVVANLPPKSDEKAKLLEELTGKKSTTLRPSLFEARVATNKSSENLSISKRHLNAGFQAYTNKDYITALKHYNTILIKHAQSPEVKSAYLAKAKLYQEMGLIDQAQYNVKLAQELEQKIK